MAPGLALADVFDDPWVRAGIALGLAVAIALGFHRFVDTRARRLAEIVARGELSPGIDTRLRFLRRFVVAVILLVGVTVALGLDGMAGSILTSGAIGAAVIGFAARQTLANVVAGVMLALTQPLRVGDHVTFEDNYGVVEDVRLSYTVIKTGSGQRILIPNERLAAGILKNDTLTSPSICLDVSVWIPPDADVGHATRAIAEATGASVSVAEATTSGTRLAVSGDPVAPAERPGREADLRAQALARLHAEGLLAGFSG